MPVIQVEFRKEVTNEKGWIETPTFASGQMHFLPNEDDIIWLQESAEKQTSWQVMHVAHFVTATQYGQSAQHRASIIVRPF
jgi:hypothetical protein